VWLVEIFAEVDDFVMERGELELSGVCPAQVRWENLRVNLRQLHFLILIPESALRAGSSEQSGLRVDGIFVNGEELVSGSDENMDVV
jgi:hypothetical protein